MDRTPGSPGSPDAERAIAFLDGHVERFNEGVRSADFGPMVARFAEDAELAFEGVPVGPFRGRSAIADAYRAQPPDDEILILDANASGDEVVAEYAWRRDPEARAGRMILTLDHDEIARLVVTFER